ncbi:MAG: hypothetical protein MUP53_01150, partial [Bacteroidales bacterium]|nr:hypothetical protein [Bacteroidales bacterium]
RLAECVDFTWFIGAGISIILTVIAIITYNDSGIPLIFPIVCLGSYAGVLVRGVIDPDSWGKSSRMRRFSATAGLFSCFAIIFTELVLLLFINSEQPEPSAGKIILIAGGVLLLLFIILYSFWLRKISY